MAKTASTSLGRSKLAKPGTRAARRARRRARQGFKPAPEIDPWFRTGHVYRDDEPARMVQFRGARDRDDKAELWTETGRQEQWAHFYDPTFQKGDPTRYRRTRARFASAASTPKNAPDPLPVDQAPWLELLPDGDVRDRSTGALMSMTNEGVTWAEGEARVQALNPGGAWPTRGPVLWAMRRIKFERFAERTRPDPSSTIGTSAGELEGDACSLWALLRRDPQAIRRSEVREAMLEAGWPPRVVAELARQERATQTVRRAGQTWVWNPDQCEWRLERDRQQRLFG